MRTTVESNQPPIDDSLLAAILAVGLRRKVFAKADVVRWADREIERRSDALPWLIGLSLVNSPSSSLNELLVALEERGWQADPTNVCTGILSLVPNLAACSFDECQTIVRQLYEITRAAFKEDFSCRLLLEVADQFDGFDYFRAYSKNDLVEGFQRFLNVKRDDAVRDRLAPVQFVVGDGLQ